ncbi:MAG: hypothetical protein ACLTYN_00915 [Dysosmobacter welbionis]
MTENDTVRHLGVPGHPRTVSRRQPGGLRLVVRRCRPHSNPEIAGAVAGYPRVRAPSLVPMQYPNALCVAGTRQNHHHLHVPTSSWRQRRITVMIGGTLLCPRRLSVGQGGCHHPESCGTAAASQLLPHHGG